MSAEDALEHVWLADADPLVTISTGEADREQPDDIPSPGWRRTWSSEGTPTVIILSGPRSVAATLQPVASRLRPRVPKDYRRFYGQPRSYYRRLAKLRRIRHQALLQTRHKPQ